LRARKLALTRFSALATICFLSWDKMALPLAPENPKHPPGHSRPNCSAHQAGPVRRKTCSNCRRLFQLIGLFRPGIHFLVKLDLAIIVVIARATTPSATATQAFQVVAPDFVLQQLKQCAFMARLEDTSRFLSSDCLAR
jgi:hypothetical protein